MRLNNPNNPSYSDSLSGSTQTRGSESESESESQSQFGSESEPIRVSCSERVVHKLEMSLDLCCVFLSPRHAYSEVELANVQGGARVSARRLK
jgi:hypothetical protein